MEEERRDGDEAVLLEAEAYIALAVAVNGACDDGAGDGGAVVVGRVEERKGGRGDGSGAGGGAALDDGEAE